MEIFGTCVDVDFSDKNGVFMKITSLKINGLKVFAQRLSFAARNLLPPLTFIVKYLLPLFMPVWFPYIYIGALELIGSNKVGSLYFIFIIAAIGTWPLIRYANKLTILNIVIIVCYYIFALVVSFLFVFAASMKAFGP